MTKKKKSHRKPLGAKQLPGKDTDSGLIAGKLAEAAKFTKKTDNFQVVTPFEHNPGTV